MPPAPPAMKPPRLALRQVLGASRRQLSIQLSQIAARLGGDHTADGIAAAQLPQPRQLQHHAAGQRHALAVVAGAGSPQRQRQLQAGAGRHHAAQLLQIGGAHRQLGAAARQQCRQRR